MIYGETGGMATSTANYLLTLSGYQLGENSDGTLTIYDIENNEIKNSVIVTVDQLKQLVHETSDYVTYLTQKLFHQ